MSFAEGVLFKIIQQGIFMLSSRSGYVGVVKCSHRPREEITKMADLKLDDSAPRNKDASGIDSGSDNQNVKAVSGAAVMAQYGAAEYKSIIGSMTGAQMADKSANNILHQLSIDGLSAEAVGKVSSNFAQFEKNATANGVAPDKIVDTYKSMERIVSARAGLVSPELRDKFVEQWSGKLANPETVKQGWHDTCGIATYESSKIQTDPDNLTKIMADALVDGKLMVPDDRRSYLGHFFSKPQINGDRAVNFDSDLFKPDWEAQGKTGHADSRDYADQVAQNALDRIKWDVKETSPENSWTTQGSMKFTQCEQVHRPSDTVPANPANDASCEAVEYTSPITGSKTVYDSKGYGFGGQTNRIDLQNLDRIVGGRHSNLVFEDGGLGMGSEEQFKSVLDNMQKAHNFPAVAFVSPRQPGISEDYLKRHPEKSAVPANVMWHLVEVQGVNQDGSVRVYNPWGVAKNFAVHDLYEAIKGPTQ